MIGLGVLLRKTEFSVLCFLCCCEELSSFLQLSLISNQTKEIEISATYRMGSERVMEALLWLALRNKNEQKEF